MTAVTGYVLYKYVYIPWGVMRKDLTALAEQMNQNHSWVKAEIGLRLQGGISHEEAALIERRMLARQRGNMLTNGQA